MGCAVCDKDKDMSTRHVIYSTMCDMWGWRGRVWVNGYGVQYVVQYVVQVGGWDAGYMDIGIRGQTVPYSPYVA